jgi:hypothetical protein
MKPAPQMEMSRRNPTIPQACTGIAIAVRTLEAVIRFGLVLFTKSPAPTKKFRTLFQLFLEKAVSP